MSTELPHLNHLGPLLWSQRKVFLFNWGSTCQLNLAACEAYFHAKLISFVPICQRSLHGQRSNSAGLSKQPLVFISRQGTVSRDWNMLKVGLSSGLGKYIFRVVFNIYPFLPYLFIHILYCNSSNFQLHFTLSCVIVSVQSHEISLAKMVIWKSLKSKENDQGFWKEQNKSSNQLTPILQITSPDTHRAIDWWFGGLSSRVADPDPDPHGSALIWVAGSGSAFKLRIRIRIQEGKNDPQK